MPPEAQSIEELQAQLERLQPSEHLCVPYRGRDEQLAVAAPFIHIGLRRRERCVYIEGDVPVSELLETMTALGFETARALESGALQTFPYPGPCIEDGRFDPERSIRWFEQVDEGARQAGFSASRYIGEMTWALGPYPGVDRLAEFESKLNPFLRGRPITVVCQYDRGRFTSDVVREIIVTHPSVFARGRVCRNPHYVPTDKYLSPDWPDTELDWLLDSINQLQRTEDALHDSQERYRALARQLLRVQEAERRSIAVELHDQLGQLLTAIRLTLHGRRRGGKIADAVSLVDEAIEKVRRLALDLRPPSLDDLGLVAALRTYVEQQAERTGIAIRAALGPLQERPPPAVETAAFRFVQEALTNVARHSGARQVEVELKAGDGTVEVVVRDDGVGFDVRAARRRAEAGLSMGLSSMEERVDLAGGQLEIESAPGKGTTLRARFHS